MHHAVDAVEVLGPQVLNRGLDEAGAVSDERAVTGREVVDDHNVATGIDEPANDVGTDVTRPSGDGPCGHGSTERAPVTNPFTAGRQLRPRHDGSAQHQPSWRRFGRHG